MLDCEWIDRGLHFSLGRSTFELPVALINICVTQYKWFSHLKGSQQFNVVEIAWFPSQDSYGRQFNSESTNDDLSSDRSYNSGRCSYKIL